MLPEEEGREPSDQESLDDEYVRMGFVDLMLLVLAHVFCGGAGFKVSCKRH